MTFVGDQLTVGGQFGFGCYSASISDTFTMFFLLVLYEVTIDDLFVVLGVVKCA